MKIIEAKRALTIARRHRPIIHQGFEHPVDMPCKINFGEFKFSAKPVIYYWVRTDEKYYYIGYALYHYADYTKCVPAKILGLGEHRHDLEGILLRVPYYLPHHSPKKYKPTGIITVYHETLLHWNTKNCFGIYIDSRGHGIKAGPIISLPRSEGHNSLIIDKPFHVSLDKLSKNDWEETKVLLNLYGVHLPDQWAHKGKYKGWFWNKPDKLFQEMSK